MPESHDHVPASARRAAVGSLVGTTVEWYDFFIYATAAALVFRQVFFPPEMDTLVGTVAAFGTTSFGYLGRPIGAAIFGHFGDKTGRKTSLVVTIVLMGIATFGIGLLPGYDRIGLAAPLLLVVLRLLQGVAVGGEWGGAALLAVEHAPTGHRTFMGSFAQLGSSTGALLSSVMFSLSAALIGPLTDGSWRVPFLVSALLVVVGLVIRMRVAESPEFDKLVEHAERSSAPLREVLSRHRGMILLGAGTTLVATGGYYVTSSFWLAYAIKEAGLHENVALMALTVSAVFEIIFILLAAWVGDRIGPHRVVIAGLLGIAVLAPVLFAVAHTHNVALIWLVGAMVAVATGCNYGPMATLLTDLFPVRVRYSGVSLAYQSSALTIGALTPIAVSWLLAVHGGAPGLVLIYLAVLCVAAAVCVAAVRRVSRTAERPRSADEAPMREPR
jgi:MFS family permease